LENPIRVTWRVRRYRQVVHSKTKKMGPNNMCGWRTFIGVRWFLGRNLETQRNNVKWVLKGFTYIPHTQRHTIHALHS